VKFKSIKGTRDILPGESHRWQLVEESIRSVMQLFNYREIRTPLFEETAMFSRSIGELTDIVGKEMYTFSDRSGTSLTLKPEMTASVIRAYIQHNLGEELPLVKVYYVAPMFRQERPQAGRLRQFHQFGAEAIGGQNAAVDADIIALASQVYATLGIRSTAIRINSVGCEKCRPAYKKILTTFLAGVREQLSEESRRRLEQNPLRILDSKDEGDRLATREAPLMKDHLCPECAAHFSELQRILASVGIEFEVDGRIVRGLDYYTKTAFEIISTDLGSQDALAGGGRYDLLVKELGGKETPGVGFAAGIERLLMVMEAQKIGEASPPAPLLFIAAADEDGRRWATRTVIGLRRAGFAAEIDLLGRSLKAQMREADRQQAGFVIVVGSDELRRNEGSLKEMRSGTQRPVALDYLVSELPRERKNA
jgi:histidyl-tRNA synthetase